MPAGVVNARGCPPTRLGAPRPPAWRRDAHDRALIAEAIANVAKHAHASHVAVSVRRDDGRVVVFIADDGVGG